MKAFFVQRWFLLMLLVVLVGGIGGAPQLTPVSEHPAARDAVVAVVLFLMAWPLRLQAMWQALLKPGPPLLAVAVNFGLLPCFAWLVAPLLNPEMAAGLLVAAVTPCTLASASVWTRRAGGNDAVAILVTIITNLLCFLVTPAWLYVLTGQSVDSPELSLTAMTGKLALLVVLPMSLAQMTRVSPAVAQWTTQHKIALGVLAQCGILFMIFVGSIRTGIRLRDSSAGVLLWWDLASMLAVVLLVHLSMFAAGVQLAKWLRFARADQIAVGFAGSQKTLMVGLLVAMSLQITILPMVAYHVMQLLVDTVIADRYRRGAEPAT